MNNGEVSDQGTQEPTRRGSYWPNLRQFEYQEERWSWIIAHWILKESINV